MAEDKQEESKRPSQGDAEKPAGGTTAAPAAKPAARAEARPGDSRPARAPRPTGAGGGDGRSGGYRRGGPRRGRGRRRVCRWCADKTLKQDYKWVEVLQDYLTERGKVVPSRTTGTCAKHQRGLARAIKRARNAALLPYSRG